MLYTEFYVVPTSVDSTASNLNGGSGGTPVTSRALGCGMTSATTMVSAYFTNPNDPFWASLAPNQFFTFDIAGTKNRGRITSTASYDGGTGVWTVSVVQTDDGAGWNGSIAKTSIVSGNWADPTPASTLTLASVNAAGNPTRLNVLAQDPTSHAQLTYAVAVAVTNPGTASSPITIEAYLVTPGDLRGLNTRAIVQLNSGISLNGLFSVTKSYIKVRNIAVSTTQVGKHGFWIQDSHNSAFINCAVLAAPYSGIYFYNSGTVSEGQLVDSCTLTACADANSSALYFNGGNGQVVTRCTFTALNSGARDGINWTGLSELKIENCVFHDFTAGCCIGGGTAYAVFIDACTAYNVTGHFIDWGSTPLTGLTLQDFILRGVSGKAIITTTTSVPTRVAHGIAYQVNGITTPTTWASICSGVLDNAEDVTFADAFGTYPALSVAAQQRAILLPDGETSYQDMGAVQTQNTDTDPGASNVKKNVTYYFGGVQYTGSFAGGGGMVFGD